MNLVKRADTSKLRNAIYRLEDRMLAHPLANKIKPVITHHFTPGVYSREMFVPAGLLMTGMVHKTEHLSIFLEGRMLVPNESGESIEIVAPIVEIAQPGIKRVGVALEDVRWITVHQTYETDIEVLEQTLVTNDPAEVELLIDQHDYGQFALEYKITDEMIEDLLKIEAHKSPLDGVEIVSSERHGLGVFSTRQFKRGERVAQATDGEIEFECGRYVNHSKEPNAEMVLEGNDYFLVALRDIEIEEITVNYRQVINVRMEK